MKIKFEFNFYYENNCLIFVSVADLPGLVPDSHKNRGLGITFLKHAERCSVLLFMIDMSEECPWEQFEILRFEISQFNEKLNQRPCFIVANKMDLPDSQVKQFS